MALTGTTQTRYASQCDFTIEKVGGSFSASTSFKIKKMGSIEVNHAIESLKVEDESKRVLFDRGTFEFTVFNKMNNGENFYDTIISETSPTDKISVTISVKTRTRDGISSRSFTDVFYFTNQDIKLSKNNFDVTIKANSWLVDLSTSIYSFVNSSSSKITYNDSGNSYEALLSGDFISEVLSLVNPSATQYVLSVNYGAKDSTVINGQSVYCLIGRIGGVPVGTSDIQTIQSAFFQMACVDGAIIGSGIGYSYYSTRNIASLTTLSSNDVIKDSIQRINKYKLYRGISVNYKNTSGSLPTWNYESEASISATVSGDSSSGSYTVNLHNASTGDILEGDIVYFGDPSNGGDNRQVYQCRAQDSSTLLLTKPLSVGVHNNDNIYKLNIYNYAATKVVSLYYETETLMQAQVTTGTPNVYNSGGSFSNPTNTGREGYEGAYSAEGQGRLILVVDGIDKVKPYGAITLDSSFGSGIAGTYIVARWKADLNKDTMELELHEP